jgi:hypothetical protein
MLYAELFKPLNQLFSQACHVLLASIPASIMPTSELLSTRLNIDQLQRRIAPHASALAHSHPRSKASSVRIHIFANRNQRNRNVKIKVLGSNILKAKVTVGHALSARRCNSTVRLYRINSDSVMEAKNSTPGRDLKRNTLRRMRGDNALCSSAALINPEYPAKFAGNFAMKRRRGGRGFKSDADNSAVFKISDISENRFKSARVRAICDHAGPRERVSPRQLAQTGQLLSRRDLPRSMAHRP